ncbi:DAZ-associated protein 2 isoform X1 [Gracilinanus agilis]|uniref:DAZ-associated protein 2 isoform X1 n=1 Tax=Gracilinanus agilis TaxID=191870 RepID=UPI001CFCD6A9|nr:DAZ-associated protein 2 isoform X1 [Gracilinanus agilis]
MNSKGQYPTQPTYPVQPPGNPVYPQTMHLPQVPPYTDAPPAYSELYRPNFVHPGTATVPTMSAAYPGASLFLPMGQSVAVGPVGSAVPLAYYPLGHVYPPASTPWLPPQCCSACCYARGQRASNSAEGELLRGWFGWWLYHLVKNQSHPHARKDITHRQHFSQCNCFSHINLKSKFRHILLGCLSGAQTFRHFSNLITNHVMVAVPP